MQLKNCIKCSIAHILHDKTAKWPIFSQVSAIFRHQDANGLTESIIISVFEKEKNSSFTYGISVTLRFRDNLSGEIFSYYSLPSGVTLLPIVQIN
ncbi:Uncharacterised protein [Citrobacter koseri]|nr:Uncharacterised protein [Citrobacter koseri]STB50705.1 Uncharacterised protein [Citrobacter koseri]